MNLGTAAGILATVVVPACGLVIAHRRRTASNARTVAMILRQQLNYSYRSVVDAPPNDVPTGELPLVPTIAARERTLLVGPPLIDGYTLRDWLVHHAHRDGVWEDVVVEFYRRAAADPRVAAYFVGADLPQLQRHFLAALTVLTHTGLYRHTVERMAAAHRGVSTPAGVPVTGQVWDVVVAVLVAVLREHGVPAGAVEPLGALLDPLRAVIVVEP